jgi:hypothetical protein
MFVVATSVVMTVVVLNYHHRTPDTHEMGDIVMYNQIAIIIHNLDKSGVVAMDTMAVIYVASWSQAHTS